MIDHVIAFCIGGKVHDRRGDSTAIFTAKKMTIEELQKICTGLKGVTYDIKWGHDLCFNIGAKMFLVTGPDDVPPSASFKVPDEEFEEISARPGFMPAPYLARHKWVHVDDISRMSKKEWEHYARQAYTLIASRLPAKTRKELGL
jgi:predicted DNA-binding protein (MmcQ/YjbR family)